MRSDTSATVLSLIVVIAGVAVLVFVVIRTCFWLLEFFGT